MNRVRIITSAFDPCTTHIDVGDVGMTYAWVKELGLVRKPPILFLLFLMKEEKS